LLGAVVLRKRVKNIRRALNHGLIMFKLGIRNKPGVPELDTQQWCQFIDENYI